MPDAGILLPHLGCRFVLLVHHVHQVVGAFEAVEHVCGDKIRFGHAHFFRKLFVALQNFPGQLNPGRLAADFSLAKTAAAYVPQVLDREPFTRGADVLQPIADDGFDDDHDYFLQMVAHLLAFFRRQRLDAFSVPHHQGKRRHFGVVLQPGHRSFCTGAVF